MLFLFYKNIQKTKTMLDIIIILKGKTNNLKLYEKIKNRKEK